MTQRKLADFMSPVTQVSVVTGKVKSRDLTARTVVITVGTGDARVFVPSSIVMPAVNDKLYCISASGNLWPFAFHH